MMKKHLVEGVVPVLIELKRSLEGQRHWLLGDLLACITALLKDHKNEVSLVLCLQHCVYICVLVLANCTASSCQAHKTRQCRPKGASVTEARACFAGPCQIKSVSHQCVIRESNPGLYRGRVLFYH